jgi:hypothetical protein
VINPKSSDAAADQNPVRRPPLGAGKRPLTIDAIATNPEIASALIDAGGDYLLALKANQPTFHAEVSKYFDDAPSSEVRTATSIDKDHGRIERSRHVSPASAITFAGSSPTMTVAILAIHASQLSSRS